MPPFGEGHRGYRASPGRAAVWTAASVPTCGVLRLVDPSVVQDGIEVIQTHPHRPLAKSILGVYGVEDENAIPRALVPAAWEHVNAVIVPSLHLWAAGQGGADDSAFVVVDLPSPDDVQRITKIPEADAIVVAIVEVHRVQYQSMGLAGP